MSSACFNDGRTAEKSGNDGLPSGEAGEVGGAVSVEESMAEVRVKRAVDSVERIWFVRHARGCQLPVTILPDAFHIPGQPRV